MSENEVEFNTTGLEIAVIGMVCRFPQAKNIDEFWQNLIAGKECIAFFADEELEEAGVPSELLENPLYIKAYGWLEDIEYFDASFFGYTPIEAQTMDPQLCIFHECTLEALENAGYDCYSYNRSIGLYAGASASANWQVRALLSRNVGILGGFPAKQLHDKDFLATRVANKLNLKGPAMTIDTACSTSLVAIHLACQGLISGDCDLALAGGITIPVVNKEGYMYQEGMIASPDGHTRAFAARAKGSNFGNGVGIVVLKRLEEAIEDRDTIYAVIKGTAINNDGSRKATYTAPSIEGQSEAVRTAYQVAEVEPETIGYIETHGTGTSLGDPVEIEALNSAFDTDKKQFCRIGSVKTNLGHLEIAAGVAGFIKTVLILKHQLIPPSLFFDKPNPKIDFENSPFIVNAGLTEWKRGKYPLRAGVSSLGIGGTNAHVILEEAPKTEGTGGLAPLPDALLSQGYQLILLSAKTSSALDKMTQNLADHLKNNPGINLADAAYTLQVGRRRYQHRRMLLGAHVDETIDILASPDTNSGKIKTHCSEQDNRPIVFMFPGLGSQYVNMGRRLYEREPVFRQEMDHCFKILESLLDYDLKEILYPQNSVSEVSGASNYNSARLAGIGDSPLERGTPDPEKGGGVFNINQPEIAQPLIFVIEYALAKLLMHWGIKPRSMIGYSFGEYVAAAAAGVFSPGEALTLAVFRGQLLRQIPAGAMLSVPLTTKEVEPLLRTPGTDDNGQLSIGIDNGPSCVVSGSTAAIDAFEKQMKEKRCMCMRVDQSRALHSKMMDPIAAEFREKVAGFTLNKPKIPYISNVTGQWITGEEATDPAYWAKHLKQTVRFADGMKELLKKKNSILIEIGPGRDMSTLAIRYLDNHPGHQVLNLLRHPHQNVSDDYFLLNKIGRLWLYGQPIDWNGFYGEEKRRRIPLPTYPFEGQRFWIDKTELNQGAEILSQKPRLHRKSDLADWFYIPSWKRSRPFSHEPWEIPGGSYWLIFMDECGLGKQLKEQLEKKNPKDHHVIGVNVGTEFEKVNHRLYTINPQEDNHYALLFHQLCAASGIPDKIVHLWSITANENETLGINSIENVLDSGFYSLLNIAKAIGEQNLNKDIQIDVVSNKMQEVTGKDGVCPQKALILGPVRSIPGEYKNLSCRSIDVTLPGPGTSDEEKLVNQLLKEFTTGNPDKTQIIAYRDNHRWVQVFEPVQLEQSNKKASRLKEGGVYLITGGLGGIGLAMAEYLAKNVKARLVLTGRTPLPPRNQWQQWLKTESNSENEPVIQKIRKILDLEKSGSQVLVFSAEVENPEQMQAVINRAEEHFGGFNGVIHSAGTADGAMIQLRTRETSEQVFLAKIRGTLVLDRLLKGTPLDFFILCSSIGSVLTQIGQVGYCAANCFLDAYAHSKFYQHGTFTSINWDRWQNVGIATIIEKQHKQLTGEELTGGITPGEGVEALARILAEPLPQVIVSTRELEPLIEQFKGINASSLMKSLAGVSESKAVYQRPDLDTEYAAPRDETQQTVANIWQNFFGFEQIGIHDDFFELGGDSLKAMVVLSKIHKEFDVEIPINEIFTRPTIEKLSEYMNSADKSAYFSIEPAEKKEYYPLSSSQKRLYVLQQMQKNSTAYNESQVVVYEPGPGEQVLVNAFKKLIRRHESLRTSFQMNGDKPVQRIHDDVPFDLENYEPGRDLPGNHDLIRRFIRPFDLSRAPLLRAWIIKTNPQKYILIVDLHHIITDGTSNRLLWKEFTALHQERELPGLRIQYKDYAQWFNSKQRQSGRINHEKYWLSALAGELPVLDLPTDYPRPDQQSYEGKIQGFAIGKEETQALKNPAPGEDITLYMKLLAIFNVFLYQLTGQEDIIVGTPTAGRRHADLEHIIGMFVNTLPIRNYPQPEKTFSQFLKEVKKHSLASYENQDYAFEDLIDKLNVQRDVSRNPVFDVFFIFQSQENGKEGENREKTFITDTFQDYQPAIAKFDMTLYVNEYSERITFGIEYCVKLFKDETIRRYTGYIKKIISSIITEVHRELRTIDMISADEKNRLLNVFNHTAADYPGEKTIDQLFHDQERQTPGYIAVKGKSAGKFPGDISLTYRTLARYSGHLARLLRERGLRPGMRVGVIMERRVEIMAVLLGILEARGAYLPIDPGYPAKRIDYMLKDSGVNVQITTDMLPELLALDPGSPAAAAVPTAKSSTVPLAYVIYTSGSTGNPKGIAITHRNLVNFIASMTAVIDFSPGKAILALTTICFDIFFLETLLPVTCGLKVVIAGENQQKSPAMLQNLIIKNSMNMIQVTPPRLRLLLEFANHGKWPGHIREILVGGEAFPPPLLRQLKEVYPGKIYNVYGPTETTIWSTVKDLTHCTPPELNIGKPIFNTQIYIVNRFNRVQPLGAAGELLIGGDGVALGYLNNVALTAEKFILATKTQRHKDVYFSWCLGALVAKLYKTGDLARWLSPGEVEFLGRQDQQVKIRGYRIELKEIENQLLKHEEIKEAVLFAGTNKTGDQYICAYLVPRHGENRGETPGLDIMELRKQIAVKLPGYMIPSYFVLLEKIPITPNGKLDRSALPGPGEALVDTTTYAAPQSSNEKILAQIWKEVLQIEKVGIYDNFFNLGGNSLNVLRLNQRLLETFSREIPVTEMFRNLTIRFLDQYLGEDNHMQTKKISEEENKQAAALEEAKMTFKETMSKFKDEEAV